jgi:hypothetical protein
MTPDEEVAPADYTWEMATKDLALCTVLTLRQSIGVIQQLRDTDLDPYKALPSLIRVFGDTGWTPETKAAALAHLLMDSRKGKEDGEG